MSTVWEDTDGCAEQYRCDLAIYLLTVLSSSYDIIIDRAINVPGHGNNVVDVLNGIDKRYSKGKMELIGKLWSKDITSIGILPSASKYVSVKFQINVYTLSIIKKYLMDSKVTQKFKI